MSAPNTSKETPKVRREGFKLGSILGTPIILANSWFLIAAATVIFFGPQLTNAYPALAWRGYLVAFAYSLLLLFSVFVHELAHALTAKMYGWPTHKIVLNLWGGHTEFDFDKATPGKAVVVAFAGPLTNLILAALAYPLVHSLPVPTTMWEAVVGILANIFMWANLLIGFFNVLPGLPLDGGRLVESIVWKATGSLEKGTVAAGWAGRIIVVLLVALVIGVPLLQGDQPSITNTLIALLLAGFLWAGATASIKGAGIRMRLPAISAGALAAPAVGAHADWSVAQLWSLRAAHPSAPIVLCAPDGRPNGIVDEFALSNVPPQVAGHTLASAVARKLSPGAYVPESAGGLELVQYLSALPDKDYAVIDHSGRVTGLLSQAKVVQAITGKTAS